MVFKDRVEAGEKLAEVLEKYRGQDMVIYGLPRGGVVPASIIAKKLKAPLDLIIVRKIGHPYNPEYAICAISSDGHMVCNEQERKAIESTEFDNLVKKEQLETKRRQDLYFKGEKHISATGKTAIIVDDGVATGLTMKAAILEIKHQNPKQIIVAVPVILRKTADELRTQVDEVITVWEPDDFLGGVAAYYENFPQVSDEEVIDILQKT